MTHRASIAAAAVMKKHLTVTHSVAQAEELFFEVAIDSKLQEPKR